jgi:transcriptional regulator with XRE-family HTH domain
MKADQSNAAILRALGTRLKQQRASLNMDQKTLAYESGVPLRTLSRLENGHGVSFEAVIKIMRVLGLLDRLDLMVPEIGLSPVQIAKSKVRKPRVRAGANRSGGTSSKAGWQGFPKSVSFDDESDQ